MPVLVLLRSVAVVAVVGAGGAVLLAVAEPALTAVHARPLTFTDAFVALCALLAVLSWAWLQFTAVLVAVAAVAGALRWDTLGRLTQRMVRATAPGRVRRLLLAACGVALSTGSLSMSSLGAGVLAPSAATASTVASPYPPAAVSVTSGSIPGLDGLPLPDRALGTAAGPDAWVTVRPGDSLWAIACRLLPRDAADHEISAAWHRLAAANRAVLGRDPNLIHPGTRLRVPALRRDAL